MKTALAILAAILTCATCRAESFSGTLFVTPAWTHTETGTTAKAETFSDFYAWSHTNGNGANAMNQIFTARLSLTNGQAQTLDLYAGVTNAFGTVQPYSRVRVLAVSLPTTTGTNGVTIGPAAESGMTSFLGATGQVATVRPGGFMLMVAPDATGYLTVTRFLDEVTPAGSITFRNLNTNAVSVDVWIGGAYPP